MNGVSMSHVMIDIETLSRKSNAVILSIGAVQFSLNGRIENSFHERIDIQSCLDAGMHIEGSTIEWWLNQSKENITKLMTLYPTAMLGIALGNLRECYSSMNTDNLCVWSHGSNFDTVILENAYRLIGGMPWWNYKNVRDTRTLFDLADYTYTAKGGHDALEDARSQAIAVQEAYQRLAFL